MVQVREYVFTEVGVDEKQYSASSEVVNDVIVTRNVVLHPEGDDPETTKLVALACNNGLYLWRLPSNTLH